MIADNTYASAPGPPAGIRPESDDHFCRRVLDVAPTPLIVVNELGQVVYANPAIERLTGWTLGEGRGMSILERLHPDDAAWAVDAFMQIAQTPGARIAQRPPWGALSLRIVVRDGRVIPIELQGTGALDDPVLRGIVYHVRPIEDEEAMRRVITGLAAGTEPSVLVQYVVDMIAAPPIDLTAALIESGPAGDRVVAMSNPLLEHLFEPFDGPVPWATAGTTPHHYASAALPAEAAQRFRRAGFEGYFHVSMRSTPGQPTYRIVGFTPVHHVPANAALQRFAWATDLVAAVLLRVRNDELLAHAATHDALTKLANRRGLDDQASRHPTGPAGVVFVDLDRLKPVNDRYGHHVGDAVLRTVAERLRRVTRPTDFVARIGGDEFAIVLNRMPDGSGCDDASAAGIADRIVAELTAPIDVGGFLIRVSASVGVAVSESDAGLDELLTTADAAMYEAKRAGGSGRRIVIC